MRRILLLCYLFCLLFISCKKGEDFFNPIIDEKCIKVTIDEVLDSGYISRIIDIELVPLEQFDKSYYFINPELFMLNDSSVVLIEKNNGMIAGFINNKKKFGRRYIGRGHGEFVDCGNAFVFNELLGVYDYSSQKCLYYDIDGKFIRANKINGDFLKEYYPISSNAGLGLNNNENDYYCFIVDQLKGKIVKKDLFLGSIYPKLISKRQSVSINKKNISFYLPFSYVIYGVDSITNNVYQKYYLDFPNKLTRSSVKEYLNSPFLYSYVIGTGCSGALSNFLETDRYYSFTTMDQQSIYKVLLDKNTDHCYFYDTLHGSKKDDSFLNQLLTILRPIGSYRNNLYMYCDLISFKNMLMNCTKEKNEKIIWQVQQYQEKYTITDDSNLYFSIKLED